jgi:neuropeptide S receptor 1
MLVVSDLMVGCVSVLTDLSWKVTVYWYAGNVMCHIVRYLQVCDDFA